MRGQLRVTAPMRSSRTRAAARALIKQGHRVLLTHGILPSGKCTCGEEDCEKIGKHPISEIFPKGVKSATRDPLLIDGALKKYPDANLAMPLEGLTVVDIDGPRGAEAVKELALPKGPRVLTGRGKHIYFSGEYSGGTFKGDQIDVLTGPNRYVMMPPSTHASGKTYRWMKSKHVCSPSTPKTLAALRKVTAKKGGAEKHSALGRKSIGKGGRNDQLFRLAASLRYRGYDEATIREMVGVANALECEEPISDRELQKLLESNGRYEETQEELFEVVGDAEVLPLQALWYPYLMLHCATLLVGDPGKGKSLLIADIIATVTTGRAWPLGDEKPEPGNVLLLSAEDSFDRVTLARLREVGADTHRVHRMKKFRALDQEYLEKVLDYARKTRPVLIVIDTLSAYLGSGRDMNRQNEVGEFLAQLNELAEEIGCAIIGLVHMNKQSNEHPLYRVVGSIGFMASVRSAIFLGNDPRDKDRLALAHGKANGTPMGPTIVYEKVGGGKDKVPTLKAIEFIDADVGEVCRVEKGDVGRPPSATQNARDFILEKLTVEPRPWGPLVLAAEARSIASKPTLVSARTKLAEDGLIQQVGKGKRAMWKLTAKGEGG